MARAYLPTSVLPQGRGIEPRPKADMTNGLIWAVTDTVEDTSQETIFSIARRVRRSIEQVRDPGYAMAYEAGHHDKILEMANAETAANFVQPPGGWVLNSTWPCVSL